MIKIALGIINELMGQIIFDYANYNNNFYVQAICEIMKQKISQTY